MITKGILKLIQENERLQGEMVFLTKQVSNRDETIQALEEIASLGIDEVTYAT